MEITITTPALLFPAISLLTIYGSHERFSPLVIRRNLDFGRRPQRAPSWYRRGKRIRHPSGALWDGRKVTKELLRSVLEEELAKIQPG